MNGRRKIGRRAVCKGLLLGGVLGGVRANAQEQQTPTQPATPPPGVDPILQDQKLSDLVKRGATMEEIARVRDPVARNPEEALRALKIGNARFFSGAARRPELSALERRAQILAQTPFAVVLGCSDSRVPTEIIYDQGLGSLFVTRVAGNVIETGTTGSIDYAVQHLKVHLVVVMGHEGCGAVRAALLSAEERRAESESIRFLLDKIAPAISKIPRIRDQKARMREAVIANVRQQVFNLKQNPMIQAAMRRNQIGVVGAYYEITSGAVDFFETDEELRLD